MLYQHCSLLLWCLLLLLCSVVIAAMIQTVVLLIARLGGAHVELGSRGARSHHLRSRVLLYVLILAVWRSCLRRWSVRVAVILTAAR